MIPTSDNRRKRLGINNTIKINYTYITKMHNTLLPKSLLIVKKKRRKIKKNFSTSTEQQQ